MTQKMLGIGNALVDIMTSLENDDTLSQLSLPKGSMQLVDKTTSAGILAKTTHLKKQRSSGGSVANTIHGIASLGIDSSFVGCVGNDELGDFFVNDLIDNHITPRVFRGKDETGRSIALVSPDSERTFATFLGSAIELAPENFSASLFNGYNYLHLEGYMAPNHELMEIIIKLAKENKIIVSLDMASYNVVETNLGFLTSLIKNYVDIVFANEEEAKALTGQPAEVAVKTISEMCSVAVVKIGSQGSLIKKGKEVYEIAPIPAKSIDTTGAGDLYAAGFLYGLMHGLPLDKCGKIGSILAGNVIEVIGAKMDKGRWEKIRDAVSQVEN